MTTKIYLVDDDPSIGPLVTALFQEHPWEVEVFASGADAVKGLAAATPHLLISDLDMPGMNGHELTKHTVEKYPSVPILVLTGKGSESTAVECFREGAADYVTKVKLKEDLALAVAKLLKDEEEIERLLKEENSPSADQEEDDDDVDEASSSDREFNESDHRAELSKDYVVRRWGDSARNLATDRGEDREFSEPRLRVLKRQVERLDKWSALSMESKALRKHDRHTFGDVVFLIPYDDNDNPDPGQRFAAFCRNVSQGGCSILRNRLLRQKKWAVFFPHLRPFSDKPVCFAATIVRDRAISLGMYEVGMSFSGVLQLPPEDVVLMMPRSSS